MKNIAINILTTALAVAIDKAGIVTGYKALTLRQWIAEENLKLEPEIHSAAEGVLNYAISLGLNDVTVPEPGAMIGQTHKNGFEEAIVAALFAVRLAADADQLDWDDLVHDLAIHIVGFNKAYEIQTGEAYATA